MAFRVQINEEMPIAVRRMVREQIDRAIADLTDQVLDPHQRVHQVRKRLKKIMAIIDLAREDLGEQAAAELDWYREVADSLTPLRRAQAHLEILDEISDDLLARVGPRTVATVRDTLAERRDRVADPEQETTVPIPERLADLADALDEARLRIDTWPFATGERHVLLDGLARSYESARRACRAALNDPGPQQFKRWRRRAKRHWYHRRILRDLCPELLLSGRQPLKELVALLGDYVDAHRLRRLMQDEPDDLGTPTEINDMVGVIDLYLTEYRVRVERLGRRVFAEAPEAYAERVRACRAA
jgi:hypothetical protein